MSQKITASVVFQGDNFSPAKAAELTGLELSEANEPGDKGTLGRYRGKPTPYGAASFEAPKHIKDHNRILWLANALKEKIDTIRECGANEPYFYIGYFYEQQCNCSLSKEELKAIADLGIEFCFSCYNVTEDDDGLVKQKDQD